MLPPWMCIEIHILGSLFHREVVENNAGKYITGERGVMVVGVSEEIVGLSGDTP